MHNRRRALGSLVLGSLASLLAACAPVDDTGEGEDAASSEEALCPSGATVRGIDVSKFQGSVNWNAVKGAGIRFGIARVSDGTGFIDDKFEANWKGMKNAGVVRGSYQFFRPGEGPLAQAKVLVARIKKAGGQQTGDLPPVLDAEVTDGHSDATVRQRMHTWLAHVEDVLDDTPIIYTSPGFWSSLGNPKTFSEYDLWVANWGVACPTMPAGGFGTFEFWQYSSTGHVAGIDGAVDLDRFNGTLAELEKYANDDAPGLEPMGGDVLSRPVAGKNLDGRWQLFAIGASGAIVTTTQDGEGWTSWHSLGGDFVGAPAVARLHDGRLLVVARDADGELLRKIQVEPNSGFGAWSSLGSGAASRPELVDDGSGATHLLVVDESGTLLQRTRSAAGDWSAWEVIADVPGGLGAPRVVRRADGGVAVFARGATDAELYFLEQSGAGFGPAKSLGGEIEGMPSPVREADGRLSVFARGAGGNLFAIHQKVAGGAWGAWKDLDGGDVHSPFAIANEGGKIEVFVRGGNGALRRIKQKSAGGAFGAWSAMGGKVKGAPTALRRASGRVEVFAKGSNGTVVHMLQSAPGAW